MKNNGTVVKEKSIKGNVVVIEDNDSNREAISKSLEKVGYSVKSFDLGETALRYLSENNSPAIVISDIRLPDINGIELLTKIININPKIKVILITGYGSIEDAIASIKLGAEDYLTKPLDMDKLRKTVERLTNQLQLTEEVEYLRQRLDKRYGIENIIGNSQAMERIFEQVRLVAPTNTTVLITGESGTGKELIANSIHQLSPRKYKRFLPLNCAAIAPSILESELFGYEKGAFTGATQRRPGKFELADQGTIFLDEISEINTDIQVKLLRILEGMDFMRVGGTEMVNADCRVIAATNKNLKKMVDEEKFREDLYYRLKVITIHLPPLRERREDIPLLVNHFINQLSTQQGRKPPYITPEAMAFLINNPWNGNVRELRNLIQSIIILNKGDIIKPENLPVEYRVNDKVVDTIVNSLEGKTMDEIEKSAIMQALRKTNGNRTKAAILLKIGLRTLQRKLKDYNIK